MKTWVYSSLFWLSLGPFIGFFMSLQFLFPSGMAAFGSSLYIVPRLCSVALWSNSTSKLFGRQPFEYAEAPLLVDVLVVISVALLTYNLTLTVANRRRNKIYVSTWYLVGTFSSRSSRLYAEKRQKKLGRKDY